MEKNDLSVEEMRSYLLSHPADEDTAEWEKKMQELSEDEVQAMYSKAMQPVAPPDLPTDS